ncbi:MAG: serine protease [Planctomycetota bacterium]|nr:MAG: serine protease [Planctomycetota bacterium]
MSPSIDSITAACGVIVHPEADSGFRHLATTWQVAAGEWLCAWNDEDPPPTGIYLIAAHSGAIAAIESWEQDRGIAGFRAQAEASTLPIASDQEGLNKRQLLMAVGYPSVINHPSFSIHRGSLTPERYHPYLCPWFIEGHLALYTAEEGWLTGQSYHGMLGGPVVNEEGRVVGLLGDHGHQAPDIPPLAPFRRISV